MSITIATIGSALVTGATHPLTTFGLLTANTVMNGFELKNQADMKAGIARCEAGVKTACEKLDELQEMADATVTYSDMKKLLTEPAPAPAPTQAQPQPQAQGETIPGWAKEMFSQQQGLSAAVAELMKNQQQQAPVQNVTVSNPAPAPAPVATPAPAPTAPATTAPAAAPATSQDDLMAAILTTMKQAFREGLAEGFAEGFGKATATTPTAPTSPTSTTPTAPAAPETPAPTEKG